MSDTITVNLVPADAPAATAAAAAPAAKKTKTAKIVKPTKVAKVAKAPSAHPPYINMIQSAISSLKDRKGASKQAILKFISANYKLGDNVIQINSHLRQALKRGVSNKNLVQAAGSGANGRFRVPEKAAATKKPAAVATKKPVSAKKPAEEKKPKKATASKKRYQWVLTAAPKKISKPSPKKIAKTPVKKAAPKKAVAKPAKKAPAAKSTAKA
uniref:H15 domain-containing protein n=1 Tax=Caenorhabditis japonica TaxID=281687 RepID=A0A8R1I8U5_CAEJA